MTETSTPSDRDRRPRIDPFESGDRVRVIQQIPQRDGDCWTTVCEGVVVKFEQAKTGSWYAHSKDERLWLDRLTLRTDDGERNVLLLDQYTHVDRLEPDAETPPSEPRVANTEVRGAEDWDKIAHTSTDGIDPKQPGGGVADTPSGDL